jgi:hypothetical protein
MRSSSLLNVLVGIFNFKMYLGEINDIALSDSLHASEPLASEVVSVSATSIGYGHLAISWYVLDCYNLGAVTGI